MSYQNLTDFLQPINIAQLSHDKAYKDGQLAKSIEVYDEQMPDLLKADLVLVGCEEKRGVASAPDKIREQLYSLYGWHGDLKIADLGNIKTGVAITDTYAALKTVIKEILALGKTVIVLGGAHDLTLPQYYAYADLKKIIDITIVDALMDLNIDSPLRNESFLMEILTGEPNFVRHYNHIGFQSYYTHPHMLETMDKLRFDCFRVGNVKENIDEMEPVIRNSQLFSFDISAIANAFAPSNNISPNGFNGEEACALMRFAGLSPSINTVGLYGYSAGNDKDDLTAKQIAHMLWYFFDGRSKGGREARLEEKDNFNEFHIAFAEVETTFLQSKKTGRWWMQLPDKKFIACSKSDYLLASSNEIPERWLRAQERS